MQAKDALKQSERWLIMADTFEGLAIIQQHVPRGKSSEESFLVQFVPHDAHGWHDGSGILPVGSYDDLENAVSIATVKYGISDEDWIPVNRYAMAILGPVLVQDRAVDISLLKPTRGKR